MSHIFTLNENFDAYTKIFFLLTIWLKENVYPVPRRVRRDDLLKCDFVFNFWYEKENLLHRIIPFINNINALYYTISYALQIPFHCDYNIGQIFERKQINPKINKSNLRIKNFFRAVWLKNGEFFHIWCRGGMVFSSWIALVTQVQQWHQEYFFRLEMVACCIFRV